MKQALSAKAFVLIAALALPAVAVAHVSTAGHGHHALGFSDGLLHPLTGADHLIAMLALGLWSAMATRRVWLTPLAFMSMLSSGALLGMSGVMLPAVEPMIAVSLLVFGLMLVSRARLHGLVAAALAGLFALFHGVAHGLELGGSAHIVSPLLGMLTSTLILHLTGLRLGRVLQTRNRWWPRAAGAAVTLLGGVLLGQML